METKIFFLHPEFHDAEGKGKASNKNSVGGNLCEEKYLSQESRKSCLMWEMEV